MRGATRIRFDDRTLSNLTRNAAVGAGTVMGGGAGLALAGLGSAAGRGLAPGANIGDMARAGLTGAATAGALHSGAGLLRNAVNRIGSGASSAATPSLESLASRPIPEMSTIGGASPLPSSAAAAPVGAGASAAANVAGTVTEPAGRGLLSRAGSFVKGNPMAAAMALQGAGGLATSGSQNRLNDLQSEALEQRIGESEYDFERRRRRDEALAPIWSNLGNMNGGYSSIAANPYLPQGA